MVPVEVRFGLVGGQLDRFPLDREVLDFLAVCEEHPRLGRLTLIVLPAETDELRAKSVLHGRGHVLSYPIDKAHLFNALHAVSTLIMNSPSSSR